MKPIDPKRGRLIARVAGAALFLLAVFGLVKGLILGAGADRCASELLEAAQKHDLGYLDRAVKSPAAHDQLAGAAEVELGFVRPLSSEWSRIGLFVKRTATATRAEVLVLRVASGAAACEFLGDYEPGPFER